MLHYRNNQDVGILDKPNWWQECLLIARDEVEKMIEEKQKKPKGGFKEPAKQRGYNG